jgi:hypothetical protein
MFKAQQGGPTQGLGLRELLRKYDSDGDGYLDAVSGGCPDLCMLIRDSSGLAGHVVVAHGVDSFADVAGAWVEQAERCCVNRVEVKEHLRITSGQPDHQIVDNANMPAGTVQVDARSFIKAIMPGVTEAQAVYIKVGELASDFR